MSHFFIRLGLSAAVAFPIYIIARLFYLRRKKVKPGILREILLCVFVLFMAGMAVLVLWPQVPDNQGVNTLLQVSERLRNGSHINLVPLHSISGYFAGRFDTQFAINIIANILMFSPMGLCLPLLWRRLRKWWKLLFIGTASSVGIETAQLFVGRTVDIDDVILNVVGVMLGYAVFAIAAHFIRSRQSK